jgi:predicted component of type VI protein secretion system
LHGPLDRERKVGTRLEAIRLGIRKRREYHGVDVLRRTESSSDLQGAVKIRLLVQSGRTETKEIYLRKFPSVIGRHYQCNLRITSRLVSRRHCMLKDRNGWLTVVDLESLNGTYVNGRAIDSETDLKPNDTLEIGPISFLVKYQAPGDSKSSEESKDADAEGASAEVRDEAEENNGRAGDPSNATTYLFDEPLAGSSQD